MSVFDGLGAEAWAQYHKQLIGAAGVREAGGRISQPLAVAQRVEWDTPDSERNVWVKQDIANTLPSWGPLYKRTTLNLPDAYKVFLGALNSRLIEDGALPERERLKKLEGRRKSVQGQIDDLTAKADRKWQAYIHQTPTGFAMTRSQWDQETGYAGPQRRLLNEIQGIEGAMLLIAIQAGGTLQEVGCALSALTADGARMPLPFSEEVAGLGEAFWQEYFAADLAGDIFQFRVESRPHSFTLADGQAKTSSFEERWDAPVELGWCSFLNTYGGVSEPANSANFVASLKSVDVTFENIGVFDIVRPVWYKGGLIQRCVDRVDPQMFTAAGEMPLVPAQVVLACGLRLDVGVANDARDYFYDRYDRGCGGFSIGPFSFGIEGSTTTCVETTVAKTKSGLRIVDTSNRPFVVAVVSERPYDWLAQKPLPLRVQAVQAMGGIEMTNSNADDPQDRASGGGTTRRITRHTP